MRLKLIKIAGFKTFVEPTSIALPSQLTSIVGPNGSGKSNIIDAVKWVLGESSAKNLRGESMTDVIFNGSTQRKPLGQASVELIFDNSLGRLQGAMASFAEISIKRRMTRDGDSTYFLNGTKCRRRDITDLFLGTGANARGYAIIAQGTVSRLIEARPEELRAYLEEAAGVSKYKERRRETLQRIEHSRENLARVADIKEELAKQLTRLEKQAKTAAQYHEFKEQARQLRIEIAALKWQSMEQQLAAKKQALEALTASLEIERLNVCQLENAKTELQTEHSRVEASSKTAQTQFYQLKAEIARVEESLLSHQKEQAQFEENKTLLTNDLNLAVAQLTLDEQALAAANLHVDELYHREQLFSHELLLYEDKYKVAQTLAKQRQSAWQKAREELLQAQNEAEKLTMKQQFLKEQIAREQILLEEQEAAYQLIDESVLEKEIALAKEKQADSQQALFDAQAEYQKESEKEAGLKAELTQLEKNIHQAFDAFGQNKVSLSALQSEQKAASKTLPTLNEHWQALPQLMDCLKVEQKWQEACEVVFNDWLHATVIDDLALLDLTENLKTLPPKLLAWSRTEAKSTERLSGQISSRLPASLPDLNTIHLAENLKEAQQRALNLPETDSVITPEGHWLGRGWIKTAAHKAAGETGFFERQRQIEALELQLAQKEMALSQLRTRRDTLTETISTQFEAVQTKREAQTVAQESYRAGLSLLESLNNKQKELQNKKQQLQTEALNRRQSLAAHSDKAAALQESMALLRDNQTQKQQKLDELTALVHNEEAESLFLLVEEARIKYNEEKLALGQERLKTTQLKNNAQRELKRIEAIKTRLEDMDNRAALAASTRKNVEANLSVALISYQALEKENRDWQEKLQGIETAMATLERNFKTQEAALKLSDEKLVGLKFEEQALMLKSSSLLETEALTAALLQSCLDAMSPDASLEIKNLSLQDTTTKIEKLGAVNLAAIEECREVSERKQNLDVQYDDLTEALFRLEQAIEKMDEETIAKFEQSFSAVNGAFQRLFPKIFGGGRANLELTSTNMLETGILVMAQPPGKRNATIQLLSGGEKTMTALALVFAIFQLNPSPFCMLDEVDAPLDDINIARFCDLLEEMSQSIQFLLITHNKITMETAKQLIGVTMREPGVSRLVSVDIQQALMME